MASFAVAASPGPTWMYVLSRGISQGKRAGMVAILGNAAEQGSTALQTALLGLLHMGIASSILTVLTFTSVKMGGLLRSSPRLRLIITRCSGTVIILFGIKLLFAQN